MQSESLPSFNNDLYVLSGNTCTLNKRRTHLIGTSLHRNHFHLFNGDASVFTLTRDMHGRAENKKVLQYLQDFGRGTQQIRTAVHGFADRYLATRSGYLVLTSAKIRTIFETAKRLVDFFLKNYVSGFFILFIAENSLSFKGTDIVRCPHYSSS